MEYFKDLKIHSKILNQLQFAFEKNKLAHAYLFYGSEGSGKEAVAIELAKLLNCEDENSKPCNKCNACNKINKLNHPDVKYVFPLSSKWKPEDISKRMHNKSQNIFAPVDQEGVTNISIDKMLSVLRFKGFLPDKDFLWFKENKAPHNEKAWGERFWRPLKFLFK